MNSPTAFDRWKNSRLTYLTGLLGVVYGVGFVFIDSLPVDQSLWLWGGAVVVGLLFAASIAGALMGDRA